MRLLALGFVLGAALLQREFVLPHWNALLLAGAPLLATCVVRSLTARRALLLVAGVLIGYGYAAWRAETRVAEALPFAWEGRDIEVTGVIAGLPQPGDRAVRFTFAVEEVHSEGATVPRLVSLGWYAEEGGLPAVVAGERWRFTVRLKRPRGLGNRHGFDFEAWALERGIRATGYVRAKPRAQRLDARVDGWPQTLHRWRGEIRESMRTRLEDRRFAGVLVALVIGDQDAIDPDDWRTFWRTGVGHLVSISGLHITMLGGLAYALVAFLWVQVPRLPLWLPARKAGVIASVLAAVAYSLLAGYGLPAQRTCVMLAAIAACVLANRHGSPSRVLAFAAICVVAIDPWAALAPGFWLSFGAVAAIFYVLSLRTGTPGRLRGAALEQLAVTVAMLPMLIALFQEVSLVSPLANALAIPVVTFAVVPVALAGAFLDSTILLASAHALFAALMVPLEALASWPGAVLESHAPQPWTVAAALVGCAWLLAPRGIPLRSLGAVWMVPLFAVVPPGPSAGEAWVDVLDVGHGLAIVVRTATHALAYDAGPAWSAGSDSGGRIVIPFLRGEGVRRLDALAISHDDDDHYGGARAVADARAPSWLLSPLAAGDALHRRVGISRICEAGLRWTWDGVDFEVMHPAAGSNARRENDRSCVLRVATRGASMLLTGDIEARSEVEMVARFGARLASDVLLVPHHGSKTSSSSAFLDTVQPADAVVSLGYRNRFRHPHPAVVARYRERGITLHRTDERGALRVTLPATSRDFRPILERGAPMRYWRDQQEREIP
ncbi:DNA internalization-related competence protein ComEC/Rec2 [Usitatibacter palustris]|uniref:Metallo-beta-lactamase domain-containing protein n=1 Tax=Usitatibacter palustris TaxID=2732487 RepID=A0A6M4H783_9PROT|nr:DNA internalization-related competence protein ComEC/Rec2 [Usitatibacter palustris]QJR15456.1 hypothetical protein DSM104440_02277 [Usitatibacter palustris]